MNLEASNKLLKILEEPPLGTIFLLVSEAPNKLLPTILQAFSISKLLFAYFCRTHFMLFIP